MTLREAAEKWGVAPSTVYYHLIRGHVPGAIKHKPAFEGGPCWEIPDDAPRPVPYGCCRTKKNPRKARKKPVGLPVAPQEKEAYIRMYAASKTYREICDATGLRMHEVRRIYDRLHALYGC